MKKIRICLLLPQALPVPAVCGGAVETLAESLAKYNEKYKCLDLTIVSIYNEQAKRLSTQYKSTKWIYIKINCIDKYSNYFFRAIRRLSNKSFMINTYDYKVLREVKKMKFDRIVFEGGNVLFAKKYHKYFSKNKLLYHYHCVIRPTYSIKSCVSGSIGISKYTTRVFRETADLKDRNYTLLNGIEIKKFNKALTEKEKGALKNRYHISKNDFVLLYIGRTISVKGVRELAQAVNRINSEHIKLLILGEGTGFNFNYMKQLKKLEKESNGKVTLVGYVKNDDLYKYHQISDCVVMPSIWEEGAGLVQCEANAAGKFVIVSDRGGIPEYRVENGSIVISTTPDLISNIKNAIVETIKLSKKGLIDSRSIINETEKFSAEIYYLNYVEILKEDLKYGDD